MVGIPGKSKGCITCKRRKVLCDLAKPTCTRCTKSKRDCEGYDAYPVFIIRGPNGLQKRKRLEEARATRIATPTPTEPQPSTIIPSGPPLQTTQEDQIIGIFWDNYTTHESTVRQNPFWLQVSIERSSHTAILRQSLLALAYTRAGRQRNDTPCMIQGQRHYGASLILMQQALYHPEVAKTVDVLAAARCMTLYEAFESTTDNVNSWIDQVVGMARIVQLRRPEDFNEPFARALLESMRQNAMIASVMTQTPMFLSEEAWLTLPWRGVHKGLDQRLYDRGFLLSELFEKLAAGRSPSATQCTEMFVRINDTFEALTALNEEIIQSQRTTPQNRTTYSPVLSISLAGMDLCYSLFGDRLLSHCPPSILSTNNTLISRFLPYTFPDRRRELARQILHNVAVCVETEPRFVIIQLMFGLNTARWELRVSEEDQGLMKAVLDKIEERGNHRLTGSLRRNGELSVPVSLRGGGAGGGGGGGAGGG